MDLVSLEIVNSIGFRLVLACENLVDKFSPIFNTSRDYIELNSIYKSCWGTRNILRASILPHLTNLVISVILSGVCCSVNRSDFGWRKHELFSDFCTPPSFEFFLGRVSHREHLIVFSVTEVFIICHDALFFCMVLDTQILEVGYNLSDLE